MKAEQLAEIEARHKAASEEVKALCDGKRWRMCIPVQSTDSDVVITSSLKDIPVLLAVINAMRHDLATTHGLHAMDSPIADERAFEIKHPSLAT